MVDSSGKHEPSMEDILASIKRIIADDSAAALAAARVRPSTPDDAAASDLRAETDEDVLELTEPMDEPPLFAPGPVEALISERAARTSREALAALSSIAVRPDAGANTLDGLVREMLRPLLKQWLDERLPGLVEELVAREIARITGRIG
ncbi:hypothetical protein CLG96_11560 [Sphingomonas oleivorans]|uniref:Pole-organizing protein PopZ n=1 Tax=Sphingomonas oleivorans TaxID=1735121 RepID=A0A2T5FVK3_9SPHN|nr:DUF2497 domain-containing protein [Sphingomonas oleivorans]PTQ09809.1 hypothetical protein CLG96_11560 [Sphingomonas oleivorans]